MGARAAWAPRGPAFPIPFPRGDMLAQWPLARPLKRVLRGHRGSWLPLLGMRRQERLVFDVGSAPSLSPASSVSPSPPRGGLCAQRHLGGGPRQP